MYEILPLTSPIKKSITVPGSKSITNRVFLIAALAEGKSEIKNALISDDTKYMITALNELGVKIEKKDDNTFVIYGCGGKFAEGDIELFLGNAGTATRFLTAAMSLRNGKTLITGNERMQERPIGDLIDGLRQLGVDIRSINDNGCLPLEILGKGSLPGGEVTMQGNLSSQYFSALLISCSLAEDIVTIKVDGELVSKPYIDITLTCLKDFGVNVQNENYEKFIVSPQTYKPQNYAIEGDASSASYFFALAALTGSQITVKGVPYSSHQGDIHFVDVLEKMGCEVSKNEVMLKGPEKLQSLGEITMESMPDVAMTLAILASVAEGETKITGLRTLRVKETDRIAALVTELKKTGIDVEEGKDFLVIHGGEPHGAEIDTYDDHRMAMCFAILGTKVPGIKIKDPDCVSKTYPGFWEDLESVGVEINES